MLNRFLAILVLSFVVSGFALSQRVLAGDICGDLNLEQCKKAAEVAIVAIEERAGTICGALNLEQCKWKTKFAIVDREQSQAGAFTPVYTDFKNKLSWSKKLPGFYSNGCADARDLYEDSKCTFETLPDGKRQVIVEKSHAAVACEKIGARLPTKLEFENLLRNFDYTEKKSDLRLTFKGRAEMQAVFGDGENLFWASGVLPKSSYYAYLFDGVNGSVSDGERHITSAVRCVVDL